MLSARNLNILFILTTCGCIQTQDYYQNPLAIENGVGNCVTPDNIGGNCMNIRSCTTLGEKLNPAVNIQAYSYFRGILCSYEGMDPVICCPFPDSVQPPVYPVYPDPPPNPDTPPPIPDTPPAELPPPPPPEPSPTPPPEPPVTPAPQPTPQYYTILGVEDNCGINNGSFTKRVVNGIPANLGEFPWMAALGYYSKKTAGKTSYKCGGALITSRHVVTAAHCIFGHESELYTVRVGDLDLESTTDGANPIDVNIEKQIIHEQYDAVSSANDIAILKLVNDVELSRLVWPVCLPKTPELMANNFERTSPFIAGWGATSFKGPTSTKLMVAQLPVVTNAKCQEAYNKIENQIAVTSKMLCAGYAQGGKDACQGDSGGPLMYPITQPGQDVIRYYLIGVVSFGYKCAEPGFPGVYTRVTEYISWIDTHLNI